MTNKKRITLLNEILQSVDLDNRQDAITKYSSYLAIATTIEHELLEAAKTQKWQRKNWQDLAKSHMSFLNALIQDDDEECSPQKHLDSAAHYLVKVRSNATDE